MTHLALYILTTLLTLSACWVVLDIVCALIRVLHSFLEAVKNIIAATLFFVVIVPPVWLWERARRPMWRTLTARELEELVKGVK